MARREQRTQLTDVRVLGALAHPARVRILDLLMASPRTATECAGEVDLSPSACSYHLRHLERFGLVRRVTPEPGDDGRERRWEATATGFSTGVRPSDATPAEHAVQSHLAAVGIDEAARLAKDYLARSAELPAEWQDAGGFATYNLLVTPAELERIGDRIDAVLRPYLGLTRGRPPGAARPVRVTVHAFRRVDT